MTRKEFIRTTGVGAALAAVATGVMQLPGLRTHMTERTYSESASYFPNPERGWHVSIGPAFWDNTTLPQDPRQEWLRDQAITPERLTEHRNAGITLIRKHYMLYPYRERDITQEFMEEHPLRDFALMRDNGMKLIPRFVYTWNLAIDEGREATLEWMLRHLDQLAPVLRGNADVMSHLEIALIGHGGEWFDSGSGYLGDPWQSPVTGGTYPTGLNASSHAVIDKVLEILPENRIGVLRGIPHLQQYLVEKYGDVTPVDISQAYDGSPKSRLGLEDLSLLYDATHRGTYWPPNSPEGVEIRSRERDYQRQTVRYTLMTGEPSAVDSRGYAFKSDPFVELGGMHWRSLNNGSPEAVRDGLYRIWEDRGAHGELSARLGYRFALKRATVQPEVRAGHDFRMSFEGRNTGFAAPHNPRGVEVVLRRFLFGDEFHLPLDTDLRRWQSGEDFAFDVSGRLPTDIPSGSYDVFLNLPDPDLPDDPAYSIRLANDDVWEPDSGYNRLGLTTKVLDADVLAAPADVPTFLRRERSLSRNGRESVESPVGDLVAYTAPVPETSAEENDVLVDFDDLSGGSDAPLTGVYGGVDWGLDGTWRTASDDYGRYLFLNTGSSLAEATFRLPEGKVLKSFMFLKYGRDANVNRLRVTSGDLEYYWDNPAPWWSHHTLVEDWAGATNEVTFTVESDGRWKSANFGIDNLVYGDPSPMREVTFDGLQTDSLLTGEYGGIDWGAAEVWRVGELDGFGKFVYLDETLLSPEERRNKKVYLGMPDNAVLKHVTFRKREGGFGGRDRVLFTGIPPERDNPEGYEYDYETASHMTSESWQQMSFAYAKAWGTVGLRARSDGDTARDIANILIGSISYRPEVRLAV